MSNAKTCTIKRTGRRATSGTYTLPSGGKLKLNATGSHVAELTEADIAFVRSVADTQVLVPMEPALQPGRRADRRVILPEPAPGKEPTVEAAPTTTSTPKPKRLAVKTSGK